MTVFLLSQPYCICRMGYRANNATITTFVVIWMFYWLGLASSVILPTHRYWLALLGSVTLAAAYYTVPGNWGFYQDGCLSGVAEPAVNTHFSTKGVTDPEILIRAKDIVLLNSSIFSPPWPGNRCGRVQCHFISRQMKEAAHLLDDLLRQRMHKSILRTRSPEVFQICHTPFE